MKLKDKLVFKFNRWRYQTTPVSFYDALSEPRRLLVTLPFDVENHRLCEDIIELLKERLEPRELRFTHTRFPAGKTADLTRNYQVMFPDISQISKSEVPTKEYLDTICSFMPKIAIDLEATSSPYNSLIVLRCGASARIGLDRGIGLPYYNLEVKSHKGAPTKQRYRDFYGFLNNYLNWSSLQKKSDV
jgi:hypothetical protein